MNRLYCRLRVSGSLRQCRSEETSSGRLISVCVGACASGQQIKLFKGLVSSGSMLSRLTRVSSPRPQWDHKYASLFVQSWLFYILTMQHCRKLPKLQETFFYLFILETFCALLMGGARFLVKNWERGRGGGGREREHPFIKLTSL